MKEFFFSLEILESLSLSKKEQQNFEFSCSGCLSCMVLSDGIHSLLGRFTDLSFQSPMISLTD